MMVESFFRNPVSRFFTSFWTVFGALCILAAISFIGSLMLPYNLAFFSGIDDTPLFAWLSASGELGLTWWIYALILMLVFLAVSIIFCTAEALLLRLSKKHLLLKLSPQIMHIGVLFLMLGHLLTATAGHKEDVLIKQGQELAVAGQTSIYLEEVSVLEDKNGYYTDWAATLWWVQNSVRVRREVLRPARPIYIDSIGDGIGGGIGLYFKSISMGETPSALIRVCRDPGALWALLGGALLSLGGVCFVLVRFRD